MPTPRKRLPTGPPHLYNRLQRSLGNKIASRPENKRISYRDQQKILSEKIYPALKDQKGYIKNEDIEKAITKGLRSWASTNAVKKKSKFPSYNQLVHELSEINKGRPADERHSFKALQKLASQVYQAYKEKGQRVSLKKAREDILALYNKIPPKEICDVNFLDPALYSQIDWWMLPYDLETKFEPCIWVKVTAGPYGDTKVFNLKYYQTRHKSEVLDIKNRMTGELFSEAYYNGYIKLRDGKANDGNPDNYYLDFVLFIDDVPVSDTTERKAAIPKNRKTAKKTEKISDYILDRLSKLKEKGRREKAAQRTVKKKFTELQQTTTKLKKKMSPAQILVVQATLRKTLLQTLTVLERQLDKGYIDKKFFNKIVKDSTSKLLKLDREMAKAEKQLAKPPVKKKPVKSKKGKKK